MRKIDMIVLAVVLVILLILWAAPPEDIIYTPYDENHKKFNAILRAEGKKATEKFCNECHNPEDMPLSEEHPPKYRCLFCHKLSKPTPKQE
jgi:hypothetical protein